MPDAQLLHGFASQLLDMETVDDAARFGECRPDNLAHGIRQVKRDLLDGVAISFVDTLQDGDNILRFCACNDGNQGLFPCTGITVGHERV